MRRIRFLSPAAFAAPLALFVVLVAVREQEPLRTPADRPVDVKHIRLDLKVDLLVEDLLDRPGQPLFSRQDMNSVGVHTGVAVGEPGGRGRASAHAQTLPTAGGRRVPGRGVR